MKGNCESRKSRSGPRTLTACRGAHGVSWMCHGTSSVHAPGTGSFRGRHRAPKSRLNKLSSPPTPKCVYFLGHVPCGAARVQYLPIRRCRATLSVCGGDEDFFNMLLTCQDQPRPPAVRGRAPGTVRVTRVVLRLVRRAHSVEAQCHWSSPKCCERYTLGAQQTATS